LDYDQESKMADYRNWLIDHTGIGVSDIHRSERFYEAALRPLDVKVVMRIGRDFKPAEATDESLGGVAYGIDYPMFWIDVFHAHGVKQHTAFRATSRTQVDRFHAAAIMAGGADNGGPGLRTSGYPPGYYAAFVLDPDGNNMEAVYREP
jgi:catechol 2,3-dioxygenase-like lactoylglutathione lyase family enzyme